MLVWGMHEGILNFQPAKLTRSFSVSASLGILEVRDITRVLLNVNASRESKTSDLQGVAVLILVDQQIRVLELQPHADIRVVLKQIPDNHEHVPKIHGACLLQELLVFPICEAVSKSRKLLGGSSPVLHAPYPLEDCVDLVSARHFACKKNPKAFLTLTEDGSTTVLAQEYTFSNGAHLQDESSHFECAYE